MDVTDEMLMALADGELDETTAGRLRRQVAGDAALAKRLALFEDSAAALRSALDPGPVPDRLVQAILAAPVAEAGPGNVVPLRPGQPWALWQGLAAASLALAFGLGGYLLGRDDGGEGLVPAGLATLATGESLALPDGTTARMLGSFATDLGPCRMFATEGSDRVTRQVMCHDSAGWQIALAVEAPAAGGFIPASDTLAETVDLFLDRIGAGPALGAKEEAALLAPQGSGG